MAYRSSATAFSNAGSVTLDATPAGVAVNDTLLGFFVQDGQGHASVKPTDWTDQSLQEIAGPDSQTWDLYFKVAAGSDSFTTLTTDAISCRWITAAWSGRDAVTPIREANVGNRNLATATPLTVSTAEATSGTFGVTSQANDDVAVFSQTDGLVIADVWDASALSGYTERQDVQNNWINSSLYTADAVAGGGDGSLSMTLTRTSGTGETGWGTFVVALKEAVLNLIDPTAAVF